MSLIDKASIIWPSGAPSKAGFVAARNPQTQALVNFPVTRATTKTYVDSDGLIKTADANVLPRDFTNGGCGVWKIEPQRTNLFTYSEQFNNPAWVKVSATITANTTTSPDGTANADTFNINNSSGLDSVSQTLSVVSGTTYTMSVFVKANTFTGTVILREGSNNVNINYNFTTEVVNTSGAWFDNGSVTPIANDWFKLTVTFTPTSTSSFSFQVATFNTGTTDNFFVWGAQFEQGAYATSYIPTVASAVTRNADVPALTGASALLNDSAGGMFVEAAPFSNSENGYFSLIGASGLANRVRFGFSNAGSIAAVLVEDSSVQVSAAASTYLANTFYKLGLRYALDNFKVYQNGVSIITDTSTSVFGTDILQQVIFSDTAAGSSGSFYGEIRQLIIFNQAPDDDQLAAITTP